MYKNSVFGRKDGASKALLSLRLVWAFILSLTSVSAWSQDTLTVYDGTATNQYLPMYVFYFDDFTRSQYVIPSVELTGMQDGSITSITYYTSSDNIPYTTLSTVEIYLTEVAYTEISSFIDKDDAQVVYQGTVEFVAADGGGMATIIFQSPYTYKGRNLLIGCENITDVGYKSIKFKGQIVDGASVSGYNSSGLSSVSATQKSFIPKTTFVYSPGSGSLDKPTDLAVTNLTYNSASVSWTENGSATEWELCLNDDYDHLVPVTENHFFLTGLDDNSDYSVKVRAVDDTLHSGWSNRVDFRTPEQFPAPTGLEGTVTPGNGTIATLSWHENGIATSWIVQYSADNEFSNYVEVNAGDTAVNLTGLTSDQTYYARVKSVTGDNESRWSGIASFTPSDSYIVLVNVGTSKNGYVPLYGYYADNIVKCQFIIPESSLSSLKNNTIDKVTFYSENDIVGWGGAEFEVYMKETDKTIFGPNILDDWGSMEKVMEAGPLSVSDHKMEIILDNSFEYLGGNLMIGILQTKSGSYNKVNWYGISADGGSSLSGYGNSVSSFPFLPKTCFEFTPGVSSLCKKPMGVGVTGVTATSAVVSWTSDADMWNIHYRKAGDTDWTTVNGLITCSYTFSNLDAMTQYEVEVQTDCGGSTSNWTKTFSFRTRPVIEDVGDDWSDDFEGTRCGWDLVNGNSVNTWNWGTATQNGGSHALYISLNDGLDYEYVNTSTTIVYATRLLRFTAGKYLFSYDWKGKGESSYDYIRVALIPSTEELVAGYSNSYLNSSSLPAEWIALDGGEKLNLSNTWNHQTAVVDFNGGDYYMVFVWKNDYTGGDNPPAAIDNVSISRISCPYDVENLAVKDTTACSAGLDWTSDGATQWQVAYSTSSSFADSITQTLIVDTTACSITGLNCDTDYYVRVRSYCGGTDYGLWSQTVKLTTYEISPKPKGLEVSDVTANSATLKWKGVNDSYVLQYRSWNQVGADSLSGGVLKTYVYDLSAYSGTGSIAIRHYNITDMYFLNIDDIVLTDAGGAVVVSEDFESGGIPSGWDNMDLDGDGEVWNSRETSGTDNYGNPYGNGYHCATSASYINGNPLEPDNWLIIPGVKLGGTLTFAARGQDADYATENFGVFVSPDAGFKEVQTVDTFYVATNLNPGTAYSWQVKGIVSGVESRWISSIFSTVEDLKLFVTDGDWDEPSNWSPAGIPTSAQTVRIDADVTIPAGVTAYANRIIVSDGYSITIEEGGQLKQNGASVRVTMEKSISGYGSAADKAYIIGSPFTGRTRMAYYDNWSHIDGLTDGEYDLYAFDQTGENEWVNYKTNTNHISFESSSGNDGLEYCEGYLYASREDRTLEFTGVTQSNMGRVITKDLTYSNTSADEFNGWCMIGNPYSCNCYVEFVDATPVYYSPVFYKMNSAGNGYDIYNNRVMLAPCEGVLLHYGSSGTVKFYSDDQGWTITKSGSTRIPFIAPHGMTESQDAGSYVLTEGTNSVANLIANFAGQNIDVSFNRTFTQNVASTICLPFSLTNISGGSLYEFVDVTYDDTDGWVATMQSANLAASPTVAGKPYLFMPSSSGNVRLEGTISGVPSSMSAGESTAVHAGGDGGAWTFHGTYNNISWDSSMGVFYGFAANSYDGGGYTVSPGAFVKAKSGATVPPFRCYLTYNGTSLRGQMRGTASDTDVLPGSIKVVLLDSGGTVTAVGTMEAETGYVKIDTWFDMNGRELPAAPVESGLYIHNGRKEMIK